MSHALTGKAVTASGGGFGFAVPRCFAGAGAAGVVFDMDEVVTGAAADRVPRPMAIAYGGRGEERVKAEQTVAHIGSQLWAGGR